jgi:hypothetical protein
MKTGKPPTLACQTDFAAIRSAQRDHEAASDPGIPWDFFRIPKIFIAKGGRTRQKAGVT